MQKERTKKDKILRVVGMALEVNSRAQEIPAGPWVDVTVKEQGREINITVMWNGFGIARNGQVSFQEKHHYKLYTEKLNETEYKKCSGNLEMLLQQIARTKTREDKTSFYIIRCTDGWMSMLHGTYEEAKRKAEEHIGDRDLTYAIV